MDLKTLKTRKMDITEIRKYLPNYARAILYKTLSSSKKDVFAGGTTCVVVLYESTINKKRQGHYIALIDRGNHIEYFSSLGRGPRDELNEMELSESKKFRQILGNRYKYNKHPLQNQRDYSINTCGLFTIARCLLKNYKLRDFVQIFKTPPRTPDDIISLMSLLLVKHVES